MAVLTSSELAKLCHDMADVERPGINYDRTHLNAAVQAVEDWFETNKAGIGVSINVATSPFVYTARQKRRLVKFWLRQKFTREAL